jgi:hypothetical protein
LFLLTEIKKPSKMKIISYAGGVAFSVAFSVLNSPSGERSHRSFPGGAAASRHKKSKDDACDQHHDNPVQFQAGDWEWHTSEWSEVDFRR